MESQRQLSGENTKQWFLLLVVTATAKRFQLFLSHVFVAFHQQDNLLFFTFGSPRKNTFVLYFFHQRRGLDDKELLPYFPYRDDGEKILEVIENMVKEYVDL